MNKMKEEHKELNGELPKSKIAEVFSYYDTEKLGRITNTKIANMLQSLGIVLTYDAKVEIDRDYPASKSISFGNFCNVAQKYNGLKKPDGKDIARMFNCVDLEGNGELLAC